MKFYNMWDMEKIMYSSSWWLLDLTEQRNLCSKQTEHSYKGVYIYKYIHIHVLCVCNSTTKKPSTQWELNKMSINADCVQVVNSSIPRYMHYNWPHCGSQTKIILITNRLFTHSVQKRNKLFVLCAWYGGHSA